MFSTKLHGQREVGAVSAEYEVRGEGPPVLFLHAGHGVEAEDPLVARLARDHTVHIASHPGFGGSDRPEGMTSVDDIAYFYLDLLETLDLRDVTLVGVSLGAWIALEIATKGTGRIARLVLVDAVGVKFSDRETRDIADIFATTIEDIPSVFFADEARGRAIMHGLDFPALSEDAVTRFVRNREAMVLYGWAPTLFNPKLAGRLHRVTQPALVLWGEEDRVVSADYGRKLADALPDGRFASVPGAGHYGYLEKPDDYAGRIADFLGETASRRVSRAA